MLYNALRGGGDVCLEALFHVVAKQLAMSCIAEEAVGIGTRAALFSQCPKETFESLFNCELQTLMSQT